MVAFLRRPKRTVGQSRKAWQDGFWRGWFIAQRAVWSDRIEVDPPTLGEELCLPEGIEDLAVEQFVP